MRPAEKKRLEIKVAYPLWVATYFTIFDSQLPLDQVGVASRINMFGSGTMTDLAAQISHFRSFLETHKTARLHIPSGMTTETTFYFALGKLSGHAPDALAGMIFLRVLPVTLKLIGMAFAAGLISDK